jgi:hypothetical protein
MGYRSKAWCAMLWPLCLLFQQVQGASELSRAGVVSGGGVATAGQYQVLTSIGQPYAAVSFQGKTSAGGAGLLAGLENSPVSDLAGQLKGIEDQLLVMTHAQLLSLLNAYDPDGDAITVRVEPLTGTVKGVVGAGSLDLTEGELLSWQPPLHDNGSIDALRVTLHDERLGNEIVALITVNIDKVRLVVEIPNTGKVTWSPQKDLYDLGEEVTLEAIPSTGHAFVGWEGDYKGTDNLFTIKMDKNITLKPKFIKLSHFVGVVAEGKGEVVISPKQERYLTRTLVDVEAIPADGYEFVKWTLRGYDFYKSKDNPLKEFKTYDVDMEITAHFKHTKLEPAKEPIIKDLTTSPFSFRFDTEPNRSYSIEGSVDLKAWEELEKFKSTKRSHQFRDRRNTVFQHQYYRVKTLE